MPKFRYRMQNILDIKLKLEEQAKNDYSQAKARLLQEEQILDTLRSRRGDYEEESRKLRSEKLDVKAMAANQMAIKVMDDMISAQLVEVKNAQKEVDKCQLKMQEAMQERKMHEKLREKALEQYLEEEKQSENKTIDELTSYTYGRK